MPWTEAQKTANRKYKAEKTKLVTVQLTIREWENLDAYCKMVKEGKATLIRRLIAEEMKRKGWNQG